MPRTTSDTMVFAHPFRLAGVEGELPAGAYVIETDEELVEGLSFPVYRRTATYIVLPGRPGGPIVSEILPIDPTALEAAKHADTVLTQR